jgi:hypothetical protein
MNRGRAIPQMMALTLDDLFVSPDHYLHSFEGDSALFVPMDRAAYHRSIFLDGRISPASDQSMHLPGAALTAGASAPERTGARTGWIFHVAHCGSTLLARALDDPRSNLVLREPLALRQQAFERDPARLALTLAMLSKRYRADLPTIVKANVPVNFLLPEIAALDRQAPAIFLHCALRDYLLAILRSENHRLWLRRVTEQLAAWLGDLSALSDAQRSAALWLAQTRAFESALSVMANGRSLDSEAFFAAPGPTLKAAASHLGVPMDDASAAATVAGPLFTTYSKNPDLPFDNKARLARRAATETALAAELDEAQAWVDRNGGNEAASAGAALGDARL